MHNVGILAKASSLRWRIKKELEKNPHLRVFEFSNASDMMHFVRDGQIDTLVLKVKKLKISHFDTLKSLRQQLPKVSLLMVAEEVPAARRAELADLKLERVALLDLHHELDDLSRLVLRLPKSTSSVFRRHRRFATHEMGQISLRSGAVKEARVINLSAGGVCLQVKHKNFDLGDRVALKVLENSARFYVLEGHVVWTSSDRQILGVRFKRVSVNRHLQLVH